MTSYIYVEIMFPNSSHARWSYRRQLGSLWLCASSVREDVSLVEFIYVPCIYRIPGGVIVVDSGLCGCVPGQLIKCETSFFREQLLPNERTSSIGTALPENRPSATMACRKRRLLMGPLLLLCLISRLLVRSSIFKDFTILP